MIFSGSGSCDGSKSRFNINSVTLILLIYTSVIR